MRKRTSGSRKVEVFHRIYDLGISESESPIFKKGAAVSIDSVANLGTDVIGFAGTGKSPLLFRMRRMETAHPLS